MFSWSLIWLLFLVSAVCDIAESVLVFVCIYFVVIGRSVALFHFFSTKGCFSVFCYYCWLFLGVFCAFVYVAFSVIFI